MAEEQEAESAKESKVNKSSLKTGPPDPKEDSPKVMHPNSLVPCRSIFWQNRWLNLPRVIYHYGFFLYKQFNQNIYYLIKEKK
jgi:hypothetical protein